MLRKTGGAAANVQFLDALLIERSPDFLVVLDAELRVVRASAGLRSAVPLVVPGEDFLRSLDEASQGRLKQALSLHHDGGPSLSLELVHRGRERLLTTIYRFYGVERPTWPVWAASRPPRPSWSTRSTCCAAGTTNPSRSWLH